MLREKLKDPQTLVALTALGIIIISGAILFMKKIQLKAGERLLDIGRGWGTLSVHAAKQGANVTGVTLGRNQHEWGMRKAKEAGVADKVDILCCDYRDIPKRKYDKITIEQSAYPFFAESPFCQTPQHKA